MTAPAFVDFESLFRAAPAALLVIAADAPRFTIVSATDAYFAATMTTKEIVGAPVFEVFPGNPNEPKATGRRNMEASLSRVLKTGAAETLPVHRYDLVRRTTATEFVERHWLPRVAPLVLNPSTTLILHSVEDVTAKILAARSFSRRLALSSEDDLSELRDVVREACQLCHFDDHALMDMLVVATELGRNAIVHGGGGTVEVTEVTKPHARGICLELRDRGAGIADVPRALRGGYSTSNTLGRGLSGSRNLVDEFDLVTGHSGTRVTVTKWAR